MNSDAEEDWQEYSDEVVLDEPGLYEVDYRATDLVGNASEPQTITIRVITGAGCVAEAGGDEFDGTEIGSQWLRHTRNGGTPTSGDMAPFLEDGQLVMRTNDFELDASSATTALGPVNMLGIDLPSLGDEWQVETQFTIQHTGGWQHAGLIVWQADNNFFRSTITNNLSVGPAHDLRRVVEGQPDDGRGRSRVTAGGNVNVQVGGTRAADHDQDALHASGGREQHPGPVPDRGAGGAREPRLGELPGHQRRLEQLRRLGPEPGRRSAPRLRGVADRDHRRGQLPGQHRGEPVQRRPGRGRSRLLPGDGREL